MSLLIERLIFFCVIFFFAIPDICIKFLPQNENTIHKFVTVIFTIERKTPIFEKKNVQRKIYGTISNHMTQTFPHSGRYKRYHSK